MKHKKIALAGNPNVGKSTVFNALTGMHQHTGNWAGKTVTNAVGKCTYDDCEFEIYDLPGTYSLNAISEDEIAARDFIVSGNPDAVIVVCDASCLERNLVLALQIMQITDRCVLCLNLMDEARRRSVKLDTELLSGILKIPVVTTEARRKIGIYDALGAVNSEFETCLKCDDPVKTAEEICSRVVKDKGKSRSRADRILTGKYTAVPIMLMMLGVIFWLTVNAANLPSQMLSDFLMWLNGRIAQLLMWAGVPDVIVSLITNGCLGVLFRVVSVMLPPMAIFFPLFTFLEDLGYLPRIAFNLDRAFLGCNACGKQALTMCMGLGCNAVGVTGCRIIGSKRERLIAILTNSFMPCNGRFPTLIAVIVIFFAGKNGFLSAFILLAVVGAGVALTFLASLILSKTYLRGEASAFTLELPPYRVPQVGRIIVRSVFDRTLFVLGRAACVAAPAGLIIWLLGNIHIGDVSILVYITNLLDPVGRFIGLDGCILTAFLLGFPANEIVIPIALMAYSAEGALVDFAGYEALKATLVSCGWTNVTAVCMLVFTLLHWPCSTTVISIYKETRSLSKTAVAVALPTLFGIVICALISHIF